MDDKHDILDKDLDKNNIDIDLDKDQKIDDKEVVINQLLNKLKTTSEITPINNNNNNNNNSNNNSISSISNDSTNIKAIPPKV
jgi:hypothetical protein